MSNLTEEQLDYEVLFILSQHVGKENAISRWQLVEKVIGYVPEHLRTNNNMEDREVRDAVSRLRLQGHVICDMGDGRGRYMAGSVEEFWEFYFYYLTPLLKGRKTLDALKKAAAEQWPDVQQMRMEL